MTESLTVQEAARIMREAVRDKSYQQLALGQDVAAYLRTKRKRLTPSSFRDYEGGLDKFCRYFLDLQLSDFEPPVGTRRLEEFLDAQWGGREPRTLNKNLSIVRDFFKWAVLRGEMHGDPTLPIERARSRGVHRETFSEEIRSRLLAENPDLRDRVALRLLLDYGLRKGALQAIRYKHFDHNRLRLTIFTKGGKVRELPIPQQPFWHDLERLILDLDANPADYLMARQKTIPRAGVRRVPDKPMSGHGLHRWWYGCLQRAGIVPAGTMSGERMHKARHTAGQRVLDATGNLKAVQKLLGHASIQTTGDVYADWDIDQLARTLLEVLGDDQT